MHIDLNTGRDSLRIVQLSDSHLGVDSSVELLGMKTDDSLDAVLEMLQQNREQFDLLLVTGDIALEGARPAYERFQRKLALLQQPKIWLGGNHDDISAMRDVVGFGTELSRSVITGGWQIICLNSVVAGEVGGKLAESELQYLQHCLQQTPELPTLICFHHHVLPVGCDWLDEQQISNSDQFLELIATHDNVRLVCCGHVHQESDNRQHHTRFMSTPSTCVQFAPNSADFKLDDKPPGVRWLELANDGAINTAVWRVTHATIPVNLESSGYAQ